MRYGMSYQPINIEFYEKTRSFLISATKLLISCLNKGEQIPSFIVKEHKIKRENPSCIAHTITDCAQQDYITFIYNHMKELERLIEYNKWIKVMLADPIISKHLAQGIVGTWHRMYFPSMPWNYLDYFLEKQLVLHSDKSEFDDEAFDSMYRDLEKFFYSDSIELKAFSPLHNFISEIDDIDLGNGLRIRKINISELDQLLNENEMFQNRISLNFFHPPEYAMELTFQTEKLLEAPSIGSQPPSSYIDVIERFNKLVTALRLFKAGTVLFSMFKIIPALDVHIIKSVNSNVLARNNLLYRKSYGQTYILGATEINEFQSFWNKFDHLNQSTKLSMAIRRFNYGYERDRPEDKLLDYMIAFEALFTKTGKNTSEISHKLSVRIARLLKSDYIDRETIMQRMKKFYGKRSGVVHGDEHELDREVVNNIEEYLRKSIFLFGERLQTEEHNDIISHLDLD